MAVWVETQRCPRFTDLIIFFIFRYAWLYFCRLEHGRCLCDFCRFFSIKLGNNFSLTNYIKSAISLRKFWYCRFQFEKYRKFWVEIETFGSLRCKGKNMCNLWAKSGIPLRKFVCYLVLILCGDIVPSKFHICNTWCCFG